MFGEGMSGPGPRGNYQGVVQVPSPLCAARLWPAEERTFVSCSRDPATTILAHGQPYGVCRQHAKSGESRGLWLTMSNGVVDWVVPGAIRWSENE